MRRIGASSKPSSRSPSENDHRGGFVAATIGNGQHQPKELLLHTRRQSSHHAEVDEGQPAIGCEQHVAGMRVGMKQPVDQDLMEVGAKEVAGQTTAIDLGPLHRRNLVMLVPAM
jgi:hypothetical protein